MKYKLLSTAVLGLTSSFLANADTIQLQNGDSLSGIIKLVDGSKVLIDTDYAGTITIDNSKIKTFSIDKPVKIKNGLFSDSLEADSIQSSTTNNEIKLVKNGDLKTIPISNDLIITQNKQASLLTNDFVLNGNLNAGGYYNKGSSTSQKYNLNGNLSAKYDLWRHGINGSIFRSKDDDKTSSYYYTAQYQIDRFITPSFFWQANTQYKHDWVEDIKMNESIGTGPGWQVWDNELSALSLTGLVNYQKIGYRNGEHSSHPLGTVKWDFYQYFLGKSLKFYSTGEVGRSFNDNVSLSLSATAGLAYQLTNWLSLNTSVTEAKENTNKGNSKNTSYNVGVGVNW